MLPSYYIDIDNDIIDICNSDIYKKIKDTMVFVTRWENVYILASMLNLETQQNPNKNNN